MFTIRKTFSAALTLGAITCLPASYAFAQTEAQAENVLRGLAAEENVVDGRIISVQEHRLNIISGDNPRTLMLSPQTVYEIDGKPATLADLPPDARIRVVLDRSRPTAVGRVILLRNDPAAPMATGQVRPLPTTPSLPNATQTQSDRAADQAQANMTPVVVTEMVAEVPIGAQITNTSDGIRVQSVASDSLAARAGLLAGDLIQSVGPTNVKTAQGFYRVINQYQAGDAVPIVIVRDGVVQNARFTLPSDFVPQRPTRTSTPTATTADTAAPPVPQQPMPVANEVSSLQLGWVLAQRGEVVKIISIDPQSSADRSGLKVGDELVRVEGQFVHTPEDVIAFLQQHAQAGSVALTIRRGAEQLTRGLMFPMATTTVAANKLTSDDATTSSVLQTQSEHARLIQELQQQIRQLRLEVEQLKQVR